MQRSILLATCFALTASAALAEQPAPALPIAPKETVVVTGQKPTKEERSKIVWDFVYAHARVSPKIDQLSRWISPVCPQVQNLPDGFASFIAARIREVAKTAGAKVGEAASCKPNIEVIFTQDPQAFVDALAKSNPNLLGYHYVHNIEKVAKVSRPIQAWYVTATSNLMQTAVDDPYRAPPSGVAGSRLTHGQLSVFANVLILVDADKAAGYPVGQIADYLAMLSLSMADAPGNCDQLPSVLDLMAEDCPQKPEALTQTDKAYLEGLYAMDLEEIGSLQKSAIANIVKHDMDKPAAP